MLFLAAGIFVYVAGIQKKNFQKGERKNHSIDDLDERWKPVCLQQEKILR